MTALRTLAPLLGLLAGLAVVPGRPPRPGPADVHRRARPAVGWVLSADRARGTGWVADARRRWLVTCLHVVGESATVEVFFPAPGESSRAFYLEHKPRLEAEGRVVRGQVVRRAPATDLALIELASLPPGAEALPLADPGARVGDPVQVVGHRYDLDSLWASSVGSVRAIQAQGPGYFSAGQELAKGAPVVLASTPINEGDSGGPLLDRRGAVVGVAAAVAWEAGGAAVCIDVSAVRALLGAPAPEAVGQVTESEGAALHRAAVGSVALVRYEGGRRACGVLVDAGERLVLTTAGAVGREDTVDVFWPARPGGVLATETRFYLEQRDLQRRRGHLTTGTVLARDERRGLALLRVPALPAGTAELAPTPVALDPGDSVHLITCPDRLAFLWLASAATVRQTGALALGPAAAGTAPTIVLQAPLSEGEGGGPVLDGRGRLVGLLTGKVGPQQVAYALPAGELLAFLADQRGTAAPADVPGFVARGGRYLAARRDAEAADDFTEALRRQPGHGPALTGRAWARLHSGDLGGAEADARSAVLRDGKSGPARVALAAVLLQRGHNEDATAEAGRALALDGRLARAHAVRGVARRSLPDCDEGVWLARDDAFVAAARARVYLHQGDGARAVADLDHALALEPGELDWFLLRGLAHWARNDAAAARDDFQAVLAGRAGDPVALLGRARVRALKGEWDGALADLDASLRADPASPEALRERGGVRVRRGRVADGARDYLAAAGRPGGLTGGLLAEIDRRAGELLVERDDPAGCVLLVRAVLEGLGPLVRERPAAAKLIQAALAAPAEDIRDRARRLRDALAAVAAQLPQTP